MKKKILTVMLAMSLMASLAAPAFADASEITGRVMYGSAETDPTECANEQVDEDGFYDDEDGYAVNDLIIGPFSYDADEKNLDLAQPQYGETAYFLLTGLYPVLDTDGTLESYEVKLLEDSDSADGLKVKTDWEEGDDIVDDVAITKKKINQVGTYEDGDFTLDAGAQEELENSYDFESGTYYYMVAITIEESTSTSDADIIGTLTLDKSSSPDADEIAFDIAVTVDWEESYRENTDYDDVDGDIEIEADTYYSVSFDGDDEIEITFEDDSYFVVDISGQGNTLIYYDTDFNSRIAAQYPLAELNFWNGNGARFNRTGEFFLSTGDDSDYAQFLYQINSDGTLSEVPGAEYDDADEGFYFNTRTLGQYVYSDMELDLTVQEEEEETTDDTLVVTPVELTTPVNPSTGAKA